jgi:DinB superfamily
MTKIEKLIADINVARDRYLQQLEHIDEATAARKPDATKWSIVEITEHLYWAEHGGIAGMWKILHAIRENKIEKKQATVHQNMPVEQIIQLTWKDKEQVPAVATPRMGGSISFWCAAFKSLQTIVEEFAKDIEEKELRILAHPHPISGEMDFQQRLEFIRFHIERHHEQVKNLLLQTKNPCN